MKRILILLMGSILMLAHSAFASHWVRVTDAQSGDRSYYIDTDSIHYSDSGSKLRSVTIWTKVEHKSKKDENGAITDSGSGTGTVTPIAPDSVAEAIYDYLFPTN